MSEVGEVVPYEVARRCPRCDQTGREAKVTETPNGTRTIQIVCENKPCEWYSTPYWITVLPDNTVRSHTHTVQNKRYPRESAVLFRDRKQRLEAAIAADQEKARRGGEV